MGWGEVKCGSERGWTNEQRGSIFLFSFWWLWCLLYKSPPSLSVLEELWFRFVNGEFFLSAIYVGPTWLSWMDGWVVGSMAIRCCCCYSCSRQYWVISISTTCGWGRANGFYYTGTIQRMEVGWFFDNCIALLHYIRYMPIYLFICRYTPSLRDKMRWNIVTGSSYIRQHLLSGRLYLLHRFISFFRFIP